MVDENTALDSSNSADVVTGEDLDLSAFADYQKRRQNERLGTPTPAETKPDETKPRAESATEEVKSPEQGSDGKTTPASGSLTLTREELDRLISEKLASQQQAAKAQPEPKSKFEKEPDLADYETVAAWAKDFGAYQREQFRQEQQQEQAQKAEMQKAQEEWAKKESAVKAKYPDFEQLKAKANLRGDEGGAGVYYISESDIGGELFYYFLKNPGEWEQIAAMPEPKRLQELWYRERLLRDSIKTSAASPRRISDAPAPPKTLNGGGYAPGNPKTKAVEAGSFADYQAAALAERLRERDAMGRFR